MVVVSERHQKVARCHEVLLVDPLEGPVCEYRLFLSNLQSAQSNPLYMRKGFAGIWVVPRFVVDLVNQQYIWTCRYIHEGVWTLIFLLYSCRHHRNMYCWV